MAAVATVGLVPADRVVGRAPPPPGDVEAVADLDALDRLDAHHRLGEQGVELAIPVDVAAETDGHAVAEHLDDATERVTVLGGGLDLEDHRLGGGRVEAAHGRLVDLRQVGEVGRAAVARAAPHLHDVGDDVDAELGEQQLGHAPPAATRAAVSRALARSSTSRASVNPYFCIPARSAWPGRTWVSGLPSRPAPATSRRATCRCGTTRCSDLDRDRRTQRATVAHAADAASARRPRSAGAGRARSRAGGGRARPGCPRR